MRFSKIGMLIITVMSIVVGIVLVTNYSQLVTNEIEIDVQEKTARIEYFGKYGDLTKWTRPKGPLRVGLQVGHWKSAELPDELARLRNNTGAASKLVAEWELNLSIAQETKALLEIQGIIVDLIPATIPPGYIADAFVSIHADGSTDPETTGFKVASPRRDLTNRAHQLASSIEKEYSAGTNLTIDPNITRNMTGYYAFSWRRYEHSIHPMTPAAILETGFLTNSKEARFLINNPDIPAQALANALIIFLKPNGNST